MKLLALPTSPYSARILIQAYEKKLELPVEYPPAGHGVADHAALNPFAKVPVLVLDGAFLIESAAIAEYLEDIRPAPPLRPPDPLNTARMRGLILATDHYLLPAIGALRGDGGKEDETLRSLTGALDRLQRLLGDRARARGYAVGPRMTLADCALAPAVFYLERFLAARGQPPALADRDVLARWWRTVTGHESVSRVIAQLEQAASEAGR